MGHQTLGPTKCFGLRQEVSRRLARVGLLRRSTQSLTQRLRPVQQVPSGHQPKPKNFGAVPLTALRGFRVKRHQDTKVRLVVRNRRPRLCPGFVQVAEVDRRCSVRRAAPGCGWETLTEPSPRWLVHLGRNRIVTRAPVTFKALLGPRRRIRGGFLYRWKVFRAVYRPSSSTLMVVEAVLAERAKWAMSP